MQNHDNKMAKQPLDGENQQPGACASTNAVVAGADNCINNNCIAVSYKYGEKAIDFKACKSIFRQYDIKTREIEALSILWMFLEFNGKHEAGCTLKAVADWSGFGDRWKGRLLWHFEQLIEKRCIEKIPFNDGFRYLITGKGEGILRAWEDEREKIKEDLAKRRITARLKAETKRLNMLSRRHPVTQRWISKG
jgi:hypothetical protein